MNQRPIPDAAMRDQNSVELARIWIAERGLHCSLKVGMYREMDIHEERAWGILLADISRHVANAFSSEFGADVATTLEVIRQSYLEELARPTSLAKGKFL